MMSTMPVSPLKITCHRVEADKGQYIFGTVAKWYGRLSPKQCFSCFAIDFIATTTGPADFFLDLTAQPTAHGETGYIEIIKADFIDFSHQFIFGFVAEVKLGQPHRNAHEIGAKSGFFVADGAFLVVI